MNGKESTGLVSVIGCVIVLGVWAWIAYAMPCSCAGGCAVQDAPLRCLPGAPK